MVRYNVRKELFPQLKGIIFLGKIPFLFPSKTTKSNIRNVIHIYIEINNIGRRLFQIIES